MVKPTRSRRVARKNKRERRPALVPTPHQQQVDSGGAEHEWHEFLHTQTPHQQTTQLQGQHLSSVQRQAVAMEIARTQGNRSLNSLIQAKLTDSIQLQQTPARSGANPGGNGPGQIRQGNEHPYPVMGATLAQIVPQLAKFAGFAAETYAAISIQGEVTPRQRKDGMYQVRVQWIIAEVTVDLPSWADYDNACRAAQHEWDRFMRQTRRHEQTAHVDEAYSWVQKLPANDKVIIGHTVDELQANLQKKQEELAARLQAIHDGCDHGVSIDAILHPERGHC